MRNETERIFDAPWVLFSDPDNEVFQIESNSGNFVAEAMMFTEAKRLVRLPELYDALMESTCRLCLKHRYACNSCAMSGSCQAQIWFELLQKVRNGE